MQYRCRPRFEIAVQSTRCSRRQNENDEFMSLKPTTSDCGVDLR